MDADRLGELVDAHAAALALYAARWTAAPEDCVQEAFVKLACQQREPDNVAAWLFRVVKNRALNTARADRRRRERERIATRLRARGSATEPDDALDIVAASQAVSQLPPEDYEIIVLRIWSGQSFETIADVLGSSVSTAHRRYRRALERLREILEPSSCPPTSKANCRKN